MIKSKSTTYIKVRNDDNTVRDRAKRQQLRSSHRGAVKTWIDEHLHQISDATNRVETRGD